MDHDVKRALEHQIDMHVGKPEPPIRVEANEVLAGGEGVSELPRRSVVSGDPVQAGDDDIASVYAASVVVEDQSRVVGRLWRVVAVGEEGVEPGGGDYGLDMLDPPALAFIEERSCYVCIRSVGHATVWRGTRPTRRRADKTRATWRREAPDVRCRRNSLAPGRSRVAR